MKKNQEEQVEDNYFKLGQFNFDNLINIKIVTSNSDKFKAIVGSKSYR